MPVWLCMCVLMPTGAREGVWSLGVGVTGIYALPSVGFGNQALMFFKNSKCSWSVIHLPNPIAAYLSDIFQSPRIQACNLVCLVGWGIPASVCWIMWSVWTLNIKHQWSSWVKIMRIVLGVGNNEELFCFSRNLVHAITRVHGYRLGL